MFLKTDLTVQHIKRPCRAWTAARRWPPFRKLSPEIPVILSSGYDQAHVMSGEHTEWPRAYGTLRCDQPASVLRR
jgi:hypothetical protein